MHLGNGAITPECGVFALCVAGVGAGVAVCAARVAGLDQSRTRTAGALGAIVFAAQMFNVQVLPFSSVHLIGGVLLAWTIGPALGVLTMAVVLTLEALVLGDGGVLALGVNLINMGIVPAAAVMLARRFMGQGSPARSMSVLGATCFIATAGAAGLVVLEVAVGRTAAQLAGLGVFAEKMITAHALFGVLEGIATVSIVTLMGGARRPAGQSLTMPRKRAAVLAGVALVVALLSMASFGLASTVPDGYETALGAVRSLGVPLGQIESLPGLTGVNASVQAWQQNVVQWFSGSEVLRVTLSTIVAGGLIWAIARFLPRARPSPAVQ